MRVIFRRHRRQFFREDAEGNLVYFQFSSRGPGYIVPQQERERIEEGWYRGSFLGATFAFGWMVLALAVASFMQLSGGRT